MGTTATIYSQSRTPESVVMLIANDGVADVAHPVYTRANFLTNLRAGPLRELISRTANLTALNFAISGTKGDWVAITRIAGGVDLTHAPPNGTNPTCILHFVAAGGGDGLEYSIKASDEGADPSSFLIELRYVHSSDR